MKRRLTPELYEEFKWTTLEEAVAGLWLREPVLDALNWFELDDALAIGERALRELHSEGFLCFVHERTGELVRPEDVDRMFSSSTWKRGFRDDDFGDVEYRQTALGKDKHAELLTVETAHRSRVEAMRRLAASARTVPATEEEKLRFARVEERLAPDGWEVGFSALPAAFTVVVRHELSTRGGATFLRGDGEGGELLLEKWLGHPEFGRIARRPREMPHHRLVQRIRQSAQAGHWPTNVIPSLARVLVAESLLTDEEADWLADAGPAWSGEDTCSVERDTP